MKLLIVPSWYATEDKPDSGVFFREQAKALRKRGHSVVIVYPDLRFRLGELKRGLYKADTAPDTYIFRKRSLTPFFDRGRIPQKNYMLEKLYEVIEKEYGRPDLVHLHSCLGAPETVRLCQRHGLPLVYTEHYSGVLGGAKGLLQEKLKTALRGSNASIAVSTALRRAMQSCEDRAIDVVPNLVDTERFAPSLPPENGRFVFGAMGNLIPLKGYDTLIRAFSAVYRNMPGSVLKIAGAGPEAGRLFALALELGVAESVVLPGAVPNRLAQEFYGGCSCFVCSSHRETFGAVLIEALSCGIPVISTRCGGPEDIVRPLNGLLCEDNPEALADALLAMYSAAERYDRSVVREDCAARFGSDTLCGSLEKIYEEAVNRAKG